MISNLFSLSGKNIVISGASSGIGQQIAITCSYMGARVILLGRNERRLKETLDQLNSEKKHLSFQVDLTDFSFVKEVINEVVRNIGEIDGLVNCAGMSLTLPLNVCSISKVHNIFETNVYSAFNLTREVCKVKNIAKKSASIIFLSSVMGSHGEVGKSLYSMTKGALTAGVKSLACELSLRGIRVNSISPGVIITPINKDLPHIKDPINREKIAKKHLLGIGSVQVLRL